MGSKRWARRNLRASARRGGPVPVSTLTNSGSVDFGTKMIDQ